MKCLKQINNKNNLFGLFNYLNKFFATEGKVKTNDSSSKAKQFTIDSFFVDDNNDLIKNHLDSNSYESNQFKNDINIEQYNSIDKEKDISNLNDIHLPPNEKSKENLYNTGKVSIPRMSYGTQSSKQDEIINELLNNKSNNYYPINNSQLKNTNNSATPLTKRNKMNFVRDGMILGFYLKKVRIIKNSPLTDLCQEKSMGTYS